MGTYKPLSEFINNGHKKGFNPDYTSVSFVPSMDLFGEVSSPSNIMVTEILPNPLSCNTKLCNEFLADMLENNISKPSRLHFEGYVNAWVFSKAAKNCQLPLQQTCLMDQLNHVLSTNTLIRKLFIGTDNINQRNVYRSYYVNK